MEKKITELADIQLGYQFRKKMDLNDSHGNWVIQIRDFDENHILIKESLSRVRIDKPADHYFINKGDVLFLSRGYRNWAAAIIDDIQDTLAVSNFFVVKIKNKSIMPEYLAWYINQTPAQEYFHNIARRGTHMPVITLAAFKELTIEVPDINTQHKVVELSRLAEKEKKLITELQEKRSLFINALCLNASKGKKEKIQ